MKPRDAAYEKFKERLFVGDIRPGQFVSQREIAELIGFPLGPVRETLQKLELEGLVQIVPQRGIQIVEASLRFIRETYQLRMLIEKEAVAKFAQYASDAQVDVLKHSHSEILRRIQNNEVSDALLQDAQNVDRALHDTLVEALANSIVNDLYRLNTDRIQLIRLSHGHLTLITQSNVKLVMEEHMAIIEALCWHEPAAASAAMEAHLTTALHRALGQ